ncbi:MAG: CoA transferase [Phenylobacterium sp.]
MTARHQPLSGVRVLDLGCYLAGPLAGMLLADQGAEVIKVDPPSGPLFDHPVNAVLNRGKMRVEASLSEAADRGRIVELFRGADVVIENFSPETRARLRVRAQDVHAVNPQAVHVSLPSAAAGDDLLGGAQAYEGVIAAATAQFTNIHAAREIFGLDPVYTPLPLASVYAGVHAATAAVLALQRRSEGGGGTAIEVPLVNAAISAMSSLHLRVDRQPERYAAPRLPAALRWIGLPLLRRWARVGGAQAQARLLTLARKSYPALMTSYVCADGRQLYLFAMDNAKLARVTLAALGVLDAALSEGFVFEDPYFAGDRRDNLSEASNLSRKRQARLAELIAAAVRTRPAEAWEEGLAAAGATCSVQRTTEDWLALPAARAAGLVATVQDPELGEMAQPGPQAIIRAGARRTGTPTARRPKAALTEARWSAPRDPAPESASASARPLAKWLEGRLVVDLCSMVAGPVAGRVFAEYGARVIKIEPPHPNHGPRLTSWYGLDVNQGKESVILDLKSGSGRAALQRLLERADVLLTNHTPAVMAEAGVSEEELQALNPRLIVCRIGAFNGLQDGPWAARRGYDPVLQAATGIMNRFGDPGRPELHAIASCVDALTGYSLAFGAAVALLGVAQGRGGGSVETSLAAAATLVQLPFALSYEGLERREVSGQTAVGEGPGYRLYRARDGWVFVAACRAGPKRLAQALGLSGDEVAGIAGAIAVRRVDAVISTLGAAGLSAVRVETIASLAGRLADQGRRGLRLERQQVDGLGQVVVAPGQQVVGNGGLRRLAPAEKPGASTLRVLSEFGLDAEDMIASAAAARQLAHDYLPG